MNAEIEIEDGYFPEGYEPARLGRASEGELRVVAFGKVEACTSWSDQHVSLIVTKTWQPEVRLPSGWVFPDSGRWYWTNSAPVELNPGKFRSLGPVTRVDHLNFNIPPDGKPRQIL